MRRIVLACLASLALYAMVFGAMAHRPLTMGFLQARIEAKLARGAAVIGPKLVILAGSNGPYSHRCETLEPILGLPCVNAGVAVGIGLDYLFARWKPLLHPGDVVYLPLELAQYVRPASAAALGPDAAIMWRHDHATLARLPPERWVAAAFSFDLRAAVMSVIETVLVLWGFQDPRASTTGEMNAWGDQTGHTPALATRYRSVLAASRPDYPPPDAITAGDGAAVVRDFLAWAAAHGVRAVGGLPVGFEDLPLDAARLRAIERIYTDVGADILTLPNHSLYPRADFFDTPGHLHEVAQHLHSIAVGERLRGLLTRTSGWPDADGAVTSWRVKDCYR